MANSNAPFGLRPIYHPSGDIRAREYTIASTYSTAIYTGDPVLLGTGDNVQQGTASATAVGVFAGCQYIAADGSVIFRPYWPGDGDVLSGSTPIAWVYDDPQIRFAVQVSAGFADSNLMTKADLVIGTGNTATGQSGATVDSTTFGTGTLVQVLEKVADPGNETGNYARVVVRIADHALA